MSDTPAGEDATVREARQETQRGGRPSQSVEPAPRAPRRPRGDDRAPQTPGPAASHRPGDLPPNLSRRYLSEPRRGGAGLALYEGPGAKRVTLHDHGDRLTTDQSHPTVARDMAQIAAHRGWSTVRVRGQDEFRREVWLQARALGLDVQGYKPRERDHQELARTLAAAERPRPRDDGAATPAADRAGPSPPRREPAAPDLARGVAGVLLETGGAPYRRRSGAPVTPFIRVQREDGRPLEVWGVGLPQALARSGAKVGDAIQVRRDGVEVVRKTIEVRDPSTGRTTAQVRDVNRNTWVVTADRFRNASPLHAAQTPDLRGAQSHLAVLNSVIDQSVRDPRLRAELRTEARGLVADELAQGRRFTPARIREVEPGLARDTAQAQGRERAAERAHRR